MKRVIMGGLLLVWWLAGAFVALAGPTPQYPVASIPAELRAGAHAVVRLNDVEVRLKAVDRSEIRYHFALTAFDEEGRKAVNHFVEFYETGSWKINSIRIVVYDSTGKVVKKLASSDILDFSPAWAGTMASSTRAKAADIPHAPFPYTVEWEFVEEHTQTLFLPAWRPFWLGFPVENSSMTVTVAAGLKLNYLARNGAPAPSLSTSEEGQVYRFELRNAAHAMLEEPYLPPAELRWPSVEFALEEFSYADLVGRQGTWAEFGSYFKGLQEGRDALPAGLKAELAAMKAANPERRALMKAILTYLQDNTRYVSIQLGIGGFQPMAAQLVAEKRYGDCKALSNFYLAMLKEVGIVGHSVIVKSGLNDVGGDFRLPHQMFDHMIAMVPDGKDTLWVDATSQAAPLGENGTFTMDRQVVVLDESGGRVCRTPLLGIDKNREVKHTRLRVQADYFVTMDVAVRYSGLSASTARNYLYQESGTAREKYLRRRWSTETALVSGIDCAEVDARAEQPTVRYHLEVSGLLAAAGSRRLLKVNFLTHLPDVKLPDKERTQPIWLDYPQEWLDSVEVQLPSGLRYVQLPEAVKIVSEVGSYEARFVAGPTPQQFIYIRRLRQEKHRLPASSYKAFRTFMQQVKRADTFQLMLMGGS